MGYTNNSKADCIWMILPGSSVAPRCLKPVAYLKKFFGRRNDYLHQSLTS